MDDRINLARMGGRYWFATVAKMAEGLLQRAVNGGAFREDAEDLLAVMAGGPWASVPIDPTTTIGDLAAPTRSASESAHDAARRRAEGLHWVSYRPGNFAALARGDNTKGPLTQAAAKLSEALIRDRPEMADPSLRWAVSAWARAEVLAMLLSNDVDGQLDEGAKERRREWRSAERLAHEARRGLGLTKELAEQIRQTS